MVLLVLVDQLVDDLAFLQTAVAYGREDGFPVPEAVFRQDSGHIFRRRQLRQHIALGFCVLGGEFLAVLDVVRLQFLAEPLIDLILRLRALYDLKPVAARTL